MVIQTRAGSWWALAAIAVAGSVVLAISSASAQSVSNTWDTDASGNWTDPANWLGNTNYAGGADNTATFGNFITDQRTVTLNAPITIGNIIASDNTNNYTISGANTLTLDRTTGTPTINVSNGQSARILFFSSVIAGNDGLNKTGPGTLALSGANTYTGTTTITQGTLNLGNGGSSGSLASTALALGGGALSYTRTGNQTQNFSTTAINPGSSSVSTVAGNTLGLGAITRSAGGTLNVGTTGTITTSNSTVNNILGPWASYNTGASTTYAKVSGSTISGLGYTGDTDGTSAAASTDVNDTSGTVNYTLASAGTLGASASINTLRYAGAAGSLATSTAFTTNGIMNAGSGALTFSNAVTIGSTNELVVNAATNNIIFSSAIGNNGSNASSFTKVGSGQVNLNGNNTYTGLTVVSAGTLNVNHNNALGSSTGDNSHTILSAVTGWASPRITVNSGITTAENITITGETENGNYLSPLTAGGSGATLGTYSGTITLAGSGAIRIGPANWTGTITQSETSHKLIFVGGSNIVHNAMTINGADVTIGEGTTTLNAVNGTGIGSTDIYSFNSTTILRIGVTDAIRTDRDLTFQNTGTPRFDLNGKDQTIRGLITTTGTNTRTVNNDANNGSTSTLTVGNGGGDYTFGGTIINATTGTGTVALVKTGAGNQTLTGVNTFTGGTRIDAGTLTLGHATNTLADTGAVNVSGGTLALGANSDTVGAVTLTSGSITGTSGVLTGTSYAVQSGSVSAILGGSLVALTKSTGGTVTLTGSNSYTGATSVAAGTLLVSGSGSINTTSAINVAAGARFANNSSTALALAPTLSGNGTGTRAVYGGTGTLNAALTLDNVGDVLSPGNSPGIMTFGVNQSWASNSYDWELNDWAAKVAGTNIDQINITGSLELAGATPGSYILNVLSLTVGDVTGLVPNFSDVNNSWTILTTTGGISGFSADYWTINAAGFTSSPTATGSWSVAQSGNDLVLNYVAVPEPAPIVLVASGAAILGSLLARRRRGS